MGYISIEKQYPEEGRWKGFLHFLPSFSFSLLSFFFILSSSLLLPPSLPSSFPTPSFSLFPSSFLPSFLCFCLSISPGELGQKQWPVFLAITEEAKGRKEFWFTEVALPVSPTCLPWWFILCVNSKGTHGAPIKYYFWGCLWGCFHKRLALRLAVCVKQITFPMYVDNVRGHHVSVKSWGRTWRKGEVCFPCLTVPVEHQPSSALNWHFYHWSLVLSTKSSAFLGLQLAGT